ncbi:hypothetical protein ATANTOWER_002436 [Ataeniobius toweri]|uniref:Uncharacterized protein n=1 Tax=Ataeniobius toweri TaxID=208326 RepID=A0ABU7B6V7_9TELE|nr:hypothetical protein [Ataeniobius toweri]
MQNNSFKHLLVVKHYLATERTFQASHHSEHLNQNSFSLVVCLGPAVGGAAPASPVQLVKLLGCSSCLQAVKLPPNQVNLLSLGSDSADFETSLCMFTFELDAFQ